MLLLKLSRPYIVAGAADQQLDSVGRIGLQDVGLFVILDALVIEELEGVTRMFMRC